MSLDHLAVDEDVGVVARDPKVLDAAEEPGDGLGRVGVVVGVGDVQFELEGLGGKEIILPGGKVDLDRFARCCRPPWASRSPGRCRRPRISTRSPGASSLALTGTKLRHALVGLQPGVLILPLAGWT